MENINQNNISEKIIEHLKSKADHRDNLDGIVIAIYEKEMKRLTENIIRNLSTLIKKGIVIQTMNYNDVFWYGLSNHTEKK